MKTLICSTCGCSLARLGVSNEKAVTGSYDGKEYHFCCQPCADRFATDPKKYLRETSDLIVCPTCLAEKPLQWADKVKIGGQEVHFCRCPSDVEVYQKAPDFYIKRLEGTIPNAGVLDAEGCCVRPD